MANSARLKQELLLGPLKKIERAKKHINELNRQIGDYLASEPFQLRIRQCRYPPERLVYVKAKRPLPDEIPLIVGDAVHNLRSALDHLCWAMVGHKAPNPKQVGFPFVERSDRLTSAIATRQMHLAPKYVTDGIHALKPYPSGDKYLHAVKAMDERDKHHVILLMGQGAEFNLADLQALIGRENIIGFPKGTIATVASVGDFVVKLDLSEPIEEFDREADRQPTFTIGFGEGEALASMPAIMGLESMTNATETAIRSLAAAFFR